MKLFLYKQQPEIVQEKFEKTDCILTDFSCNLGGRIAGYDEFVQKDFNALKNYIEKVYDDNREVESFFSVFVYKTCYENIYFVTSENFDTKDNDFIQYKLLFTKNKNKQG